MGYALPGPTTTTGSWDKLFSSGQIFRNQTGEAYADTMDIDGTRKILPIEGRQFGNLLTRMYCMRFGRMPAKKEIQRVAVPNKCLGGHLAEAYHAFADSPA